MAEQIIRGQTVSIVSTVTVDGVVIDITGATVKTIVKSNIRDTDAAAVITKTGGSGITITSPLNGQLTTTLTAADTNALPTENTFYYEVIVKLTDGTVIRSGIGEFVVLGNVLKTLP